MHVALQDLAPEHLHTCKAGSIESTTEWQLVDCRWVQKVMENGFRTPQGSLTVFGLMGCPVWLWTRRWEAWLSNCLT